MIFRYRFGSLVCSRSIPGVSTPLGPLDSGWYGDSHLVAESITPALARVIVQAVGGLLVEGFQRALPPEQRTYRPGAELTLLGLIETIEAGRPAIIRYGKTDRTKSASLLADMALSTLRSFTEGSRAFEAIRLMCAAEVIAELDVRPPVVPVTHSSDGALDEDGDVIDPRQLQRHVFALGPYGAWPETECEAIETIRQHREWREGLSVRVGRCAIWKPGWGFSLRPAADDGGDQ